MLKHITELTSEHPDFQVLEDLYKASLLSRAIKNMNDEFLQGLDLLGKKTSLSQKDNVYHATLFGMILYHIHYLWYRKMEIEHAEKYSKVFEQFYNLAFMKALRAIRNCAQHPDGTETLANQEAIKYMFHVELVSRKKGDIYETVAQDKGSTRTLIAHSAIHADAIASKLGWHLGNTNFAVHTLSEPYIKKKEENK